MAELAEDLEGACKLIESKNIQETKSINVDGVNADVCVKFDIKEDIIECDLNKRFDPSTLRPEPNDELNFQFDISKTVFERPEMKEYVRQSNPMFVNGHWARNGLVPLSNVLIQLNGIYPEWFKRHKFT